MTRVVLVVLTLLVVAFAGCTSSPDDAAEAPDDDPILHTSPVDRGNASEEDRRRSHLHDYWGNAREIVVFDETFGASCYCGTGAPLFRFEPPGGAVFPQGTRWINFTAEWDDNALAAYTEPHLWVETAEDFAPWEAGPFENGDTMMFEVGPNASDLPHELLSNWAFEIRVQSDNPSGLWHRQGEVRVSATAARGHPLEVFPPHPDLWNRAVEIPLFEATDGAEPFYLGNPETGQTGNTWLGPYVPDEGLVVPYDAARVTVEVEYEADAIVPFTLAYHGADTREWTLVAPNEQETGRAFYELVLEPEQADGPYAKQSHWVFEVWTDDDETPFFVGSYEIRATAHKEVA